MSFLAIPNSVPESTVTLLREEDSDVKKNMIPLTKPNVSHCPTTHYKAPRKVIEAWPEEPTRTASPCKNILNQTRVMK